MKALPRLCLEVKAIHTAKVIIPHGICPLCWLRSHRVAEIRLQVRFQEHLTIHYCPLKECGYEAKECSSASRVAFMEAQKYIYLHPKRGKLTIVRTK